MKEFWRQLTTLWKRLETAQRATIVLVGLAFLAIVAALTYGATRPEMRTLVRDMGRAEVADIAVYLEEEQIPYEIVDHGTAILVSAEYQYILRKTLAEQDLLGDTSTGFELLSEASFADSTFREQKNYDRAVAGEIERSVKTIDGVRNARVIIVRPQPSPFIGEDEHKASASVFLDMTEGRRLNDAQVTGIVRLCAGAVEGLARDHVEVVDESGPLTPDEENSGAMLATSSLEAERERERYLMKKGQQILDRVLGPGRSMVTIAVDLDFTERSEAVSDPTGSVVLRETTVITDESTPIPVDGGLAGTASNVEGAATGRATSETATKTMEDANRDYVVGEKRTTLNEEIGQTAGMTVSILLDYKPVETPQLDADGNPVTTEDGIPVTETVWQEYAPEERAQFQELVLGAIGFDAAKHLQLDLTRGKPETVEKRFSVSVQSMRMFKPEEEIVQQAGLVPLQSEDIRDYIRYGLAAVVALGLLAVARGQLKRSHLAWQAEQERKRKELEERQRAESEKKNSPEALKEQRLNTREAIREQIMENPQLASQVLRRWIYE